jgi:CoA:oxalate CoA-transferase
MRAVRGTIPRAQHPVGPLSGRLVLDFGQTAVGPVTAMFLGYLGATVIKVEQPRGDLGRFDVTRKGGTGHTFLSTNLGKYGVIVDFKDPLERAQGLALIARADVLIDNFRNPDVMRRLGLDYFDVLRSTNPRLVYLQASSFQGRGPLRGYPSFEWAAQAVSGFAGSTGKAGGRPEFSRGTAFLDWSGAMMNTIAVLAGLHRQEVTGEGSMLSTSQFGTSVFVGSSRLTTSAHDEDAPARLGHEFGRDMLDRAFATADGYVSVCAPTNAVWQRLMNAVHLPRDTPIEPTGVELEPLLKSASTDEWLARLRQARVPTGPARATPTLLEALRSEPQVLAEGLLRSYDSPRGALFYPAPPWAVVDAAEVPPRPAPELGEHDPLLRRLLEPAEDSVATPDRDTEGHWQMTPLSAARPLDGVAILEVGTGLAAGTAGMVLAQLGAAVTKVVPPGGDRSVASERHAVAVERQLHHEKAIEQLDLSARPGQVRLTELIGRASAVIICGPMRFRRTFKLEEADVRAIQSHVIYCGLTGFGATGPLADLPATELDIQLIGGLTRQLGRPDQLPVRNGFDLVSVNTGYAAAQAVLAGLLGGQPERTAGRHFEVSLLRTAVALNGWNVTAESGHDGVEGKQTLAAHWPPDHGYACRDRQALISMRNNDEGWVKLFVALERVDVLADERFNTLESLRANEWRLPGLLSATTSRMTADELKDVVEGCGGELLFVLEPAEVLGHPQTRAQQLVRSGSALMELPIYLVTR